MESICFNNKKGQKIAALISSCTPRPESTVVIVCHGFTGSKEGRGRAVEMSGFMAKNGIDSLLFDFAGCGGSEGSFEDISLSSHIEDLHSAVDFCTGLGFSRIITAGRSFGGTTALCQAASDNRVMGVCTWAAPSSLSDLFLGFTDEDLPEDESSLVCMAGDSGIIYLKKSFFTDLSKHDVTQCASRITPRPLLVVQGTLDSVVPPEDARKIFLSAGEPKELFLLNGADHQFSDHYLTVWNKFLLWIKKISS